MHKIKEEDKVKEEVTTLQIYLHIFLIVQHIFWNAPHS